MDSRSRLLDAAADQIAAAPGGDVSLRAVCEAAGVTMPTLYHFFGSKQGLLDAVIERGFDMYLGAKEATGSTGDPIADLRRGWDVHVDFGLANPGFYTLMYGTVQPGRSPPPRRVRVGCCGRSPPARPSRADWWCPRSRPPRTCWSRTSG